METPFGFHGPMKMDMEALGIDYEKYRLFQINPVIHKLHLMIFVTGGLFFHFVF